MTVKRIISLTAAVFILLMGMTLSAQSSFKIVVNDANPVNSLSKSEVQRLFLKKTNQWEDGTQVKPIDLNPDSPVRINFTKDVLNKTVSAVKSYWQGKIFSGAGLPPQEVTTYNAVLEWVRNNPGSIGYVSSSTSVGSGVKVLTIE